MLVSKLRSGISKTKVGPGGLVRVALFWKSHCATCSPASVISYHVTGSCKGPIEATPTKQYLGQAPRPFEIRGSSRGIKGAVTLVNTVFWHQVLQEVEPSLFHLIFISGDIYYTRQPLMQLFLKRGNRNMRQKQLL